MKKRPVLLGLLVFGLLLTLFLVSLLVLGFLSGEEGSWGGAKVAVVEVKGVILDPQPVVERLVRFRKNERVKAIVLRIDSPGGAVGPSQEIYAEVKKARQEKKVLASVGSVAASGGYYIACAADQILANPGAITGSIGVLVESINMEDLFQKLGLRATVVKSGRHKDMGSPFRPMSEEERKLLQGVLDNIHEQFIRAVAEGRKLPLEKVRELADGRVFSGDQARALGLIDGLGSLQDTIAQAARMAGIVGEPAVIYPEKKRFSLLDLVLKEAIQVMWRTVQENSSQFYFLYSLPQN
ncbi:MAG: signal peptide peptidase SppA [Deltaproteobacteria bacterium]|nr:signal peptide peptidase SppA [Deltaproteobacteria bacterium]